MSTETVAEEARSLFTQTYQSTPSILVMAPGRVNLIGEHTDYQNGFVCPMALEKYTAMAGSFTPARNGAPVVRCTSKDFATGSFAITDHMQPLPRTDPSSWMNYLIGVVHAYLPLLTQLSIAVDINVTIVSNVPFGSGLSSSAALETAMAKLLEAVIRLHSENIGTWDPEQCQHNDVQVVTSTLRKNLATSTASTATSSTSLTPLDTRVQHVLASLSTKINAVATALRCQQAEHVYGGVQCGIMDQYVSACATANHAIMIDCSTLASFEVPMPANVAIIVTKTNVQHSLGDSAYNERVQECNDAVTVLNAHAALSTDAAATTKTYTTLRDVATVDELHAAFHTSARVLASTAYSAIVLRRAQHVVGENQRVVDFRRHMMSGNFEGAGHCMYASHTSLQHDYEVSCTELDELVHIAREMGVEKGVYGARMTGGGFGGCSVTMVRADQADQVCSQIEQKYRALHPHMSASYAGRLSFVTRAGRGAGILEPCALRGGYYSSERKEAGRYRELQQQRIEARQLMVGISVVVVGALSLLGALR